MGLHKARRRKQKKSSKSKKWSTDERMLKKENKDFEEYYKTQQICKTEEEWKQFLKSTKEPLPSSFRINSVIPFSGKIRETIQQKYIPEIKKILEAGDVTVPVRDEMKQISVDTPIEARELKELTWYPNQNGYQIDISLKYMKKIPQLDEFREFLVKNNTVGNINRCEAVSMIPPLLLDVNSNHVVLDMCAAPGSKTSQLVEALHFDEKGEYVRDPKGYVIANELQQNRAFLLEAQTRRYGSPNYSVCQNKAQCLPSLIENSDVDTYLTDELRRKKPADLYDPKQINSFDERVDLNNQLLTRAKYDRILCDVPCSGDGTGRKNREVWTWTVQPAYGLHKLQVDIARRGLILLKSTPGSRLVYSTCSLNPIENEAVVAQLLREFNPDPSNMQYELYDPSKDLPGLVRNPGLKTWKVRSRLSKDPVYYTKYTEMPEEERQSSVRRIFRSYFPPTEKWISDQLDRCLRILPHLNNSGGFFVAVFIKTGTNTLRKRKTSPHPIEEEKEVEAKQEPTKEKSTPKNGFEWREDPFFSIFSKRAYTGLTEQESLESAKSIQHASERFFFSKTGFPVERLFCRSSKKRRLYYVPEALRKIILTQYQRNRQRPLSCGLTVFEAIMRPKYEYRVCQTGVHILYPYLLKLEKADYYTIVLSLPLKAFLGLLSSNQLDKEKTIAMCDEVEGDKLEAIKKNMSALQNGSVLIVADTNHWDIRTGQGDKNFFHYPFIFVAMSYDKSIKPFISKRERASMKEEIDMLSNLLS